VFPKLDEGPTSRFGCDCNLFHPATHLQGAATTQGRVLTIGEEEEDVRLQRILLCSSGDTHLLAEEKWMRSSPHHLQHWNSRAMPLDIIIPPSQPNTFSRSWLSASGTEMGNIPVKSQKVDGVV